MLLLPATMLQPTLGGVDERVMQTNLQTEQERESIPRGVPLRQRQLPASFWQEPNRACPPPSAPTYGSMHVVPDPSTMAQRVSAEYGPWSAMTAVPGTANADYGYGTAATSVLPSLPCSCPHCTEKHYRAAQMVTYPWASVPESEMKSRVDGWVWASQAPQKGPQAHPTAVMPPFQNPYGVPVSVGTTVGLGDVGDPYSAGHQGAFWKTNSNGTVNNAGYWPMPYSFN